MSNGVQRNDGAGERGHDCGYNEWIDAPIGAGERGHDCGYNDKICAPMWAGEQRQRYADMMIGYAPPCGQGSSGNDCSY